MFYSDFLERGWGLFEVYGTLPGALKQEKVCFQEGWFHFTSNSETILGKDSNITRWDSHSLQNEFWGRQTWDLLLAPPASYGNIIYIYIESKLVSYC